MNTNGLWEWFRSVWGLLVALTVVGFAVIGLAAGPGFNSLGQVALAAAKRDAASLATVFALLNLALTSSIITFAVVRYSAAQKVFTDNSQAALNVSKILEQILSYLRFSAGKVFFDDIPELWAPFTGDFFIARNPTFALEVVWMYLPGNAGFWRLQADPARVQVWSRRLSAKGPRRIDLIFMVGPDTFSSGKHPNPSPIAVDNIVRFLFLMRRVREINPKADFDRVTAYLVAAARSHQSVFNGVRPTATGTEQVGITYAHNRDPISERRLSDGDLLPEDPRPLVITADQERVARWLKESHQWRAAAHMAVSIKQLELMWGHLVPTDETDTMRRLGPRDWLPKIDQLTDITGRENTVVEMGDGSFSIT